MPHTSLSLPPGTLWNNIRSLRHQQYMTQEQLAACTGVSRQTIVSIERGHSVPSALLAFRISNALDSSIADVFFMSTTLSL